MSNTAYGVRLPIFKLKLFWYIEKQPGHSSEELGQHFDKTAACIRSHIWQINDLFMNTTIKIGGGRWTGYYIDKGKS